MQQVPGKFWATILVGLFALGVASPAVRAAEVNSTPTEALTGYTDWAVSQDYTEVRIAGETYDNPTMLVKVSPTKYLFINPWADYLTDPRVRASRTPEQQERIVETVAASTLMSLALQFPNVEPVLIGNRPWQEHALAHYYLDALPVEYRELAANPDVRGYLAEIIQGQVSVSYAGRAIRNGVAVVGEAYHFYRSPDEVPLAGDVLAPEAYREVETPYREFIKTIGAEWPAGWSYTGGPTKQVEVVLYLGRTDLTVYENPGTAEENSEARWLDQPAVAPEGYTLIPARAVFEAFGAEVTWLGDVQQVVVDTPHKRVELTIGSNMALVTTKDGFPVSEYLPMQAPVQLLNGRTVIPLRFVAEALGYEVEWDALEQRITVRATVLN